MGRRAGAADPSLHSGYESTRHMAPPTAAMNWSSPADRGIVTSELYEVGIETDPNR